MEDIIHKIYKALYKEAGVDFDSIDKSEDFYMDYYVPQSKQDEIIEKHLKRLTPLKKVAIRNSVNLGVSPVGVKKFFYIGGIKGDKINFSLNGKTTDTLEVGCNLIVHYGNRMYIFPKMVEFEGSLEGFSFKTENKSFELTVRYE